MKKIAFILAFGLIFSIGNGFAQTKTAKTRFSSVYTDLKKNCKTVRGGEGQDDAFDCRGVGGYRVAVWYSAAAEIVAVNPPDKSESISLDTHDIAADYSKRKIEWRLANGKPFAVIFRVDKYGDEKKNDYDIFGKKIGEELKVIGLKGFENISFTVDAKTPDANAKAREAADNAFSQK
ncbi:MAG: hypothetical protein LUM44_20240 [Pyrinomonadaceae bacterium]|nr:hypothetical protein [Pyrinomonadaceae bacterium]